MLPFETKLRRSEVGEVSGRRVAHGGGEQVAKFSESEKRPEESESKGLRSISQKKRLYSKRSKGSGAGASLTFRKFELYMSNYFGEIPHRFAGVFERRAQLI